MGVYLGSNAVDLFGGQPLNTSWTKIASDSFNVSTTSTSQTSCGTINLGSEYYDKDKILWVRIRDRAGKRNGYLYGTDNIILNYYDANGLTSSVTAAARLVHRVSSSGEYTSYSGAYGVYVYSITSDGVLNIYQRYNSTYTLTINGTYDVDVYELEYIKGKEIYE